MPTPKDKELYQLAKKKADEIDKTNLKKQIKEKQIIKGKKNLKPFKARKQN